MRTRRCLGRAIHHSDERSLSSAAMKPGLVIVGASLAGLRSAEAARMHGFRGSITVVGEESDWPYERPELSKGFLSRHLDGPHPGPGALDPADLELRRATFGPDDQIEWLLGHRAEKLDVENHEVVLDRGKSLPFSMAVVATGASARRMPAFEKQTGTHVLRSLADARSLRSDLVPGARLVVVGAGFIGCEVAASAVRRGVEVTIVEPLAQPLVRGLGPELGGHIVELHRRHGVTVKLGTSIVEVVGDVRPEEVVCSDGERIPVDVVVFGVGAEPNTAWLSGSGLTLENGVVCDEYCRAAPDVTAVGDVSRFFHAGYGALMRLEHWTNATEQAVVAMGNLINPDQPRRYVPVPFFWTDQYDQKWQLAGRINPGDHMYAVQGDPAAGSFFALFGPDPAGEHQPVAGDIAGAFTRGVTAAVGVNQPRRVMRAMRMIAADLSMAEALTAF